MNADSHTVETILTALGVRMPMDFLAKLEIEEYLDELDHEAALVSGERQRLTGLLHAAVHVNAGQPDDAATVQGALTVREQQVIEMFKVRHQGDATLAGRYALGNILVATGQITRAELEVALHGQLQTGRLLGEELVNTGRASAAHVDGGLVLQRKLIACALALFVGLTPVPVLTSAAAAAPMSAAMPVTVTVLANAKIQSGYQATQITVTAADVARGYVDVPSASRFSVATNSRSGYLLEFHPVGNLIESAQVQGLGNTVQLGEDGGAIVQRTPLVQNLTHELSFRFALGSDAVPGNYPFPLQMTVRALY